MASENADHLVRMVNQIALNFAYLPEEAAAERVAAHLRRFWAPAMLARLQELVACAPAGLEPIALRAIGSLG